MTGTTYFDSPPTHSAARPARATATRPAASILPRHLLSAGDLSRAGAELVLDTAERIDQAIAGREVRKLPTLRGRTVVNLFFEDSTRTRISFELAAKRLSADVINFSGRGRQLKVIEGPSRLQVLGADAVGLPALGFRCAAAVVGLGRRPRRERRGRHPRAPHPGLGATGRPRCAGTSRAPWTAGGSWWSAMCCTPGSPGQTCSCCPPGRPGHQVLQ